jgi:hypothetical protein
MAVAIQELDTFGGDIAPFWRDKPESNVGLLKPEELPIYEWPVNMDEELSVFSKFQSGTDIHLSDRRYVYTHRRENNNEIWSISEPLASRRISGDIKLFYNRVHNLIKTSEGKLYAHQHLCVDRYNQGEIVPVRVEKYIRPLDAHSLDVFALNYEYLKADYLAKIEK